MNSTKLMEKVAEVAPEKYDYLLKTAGEIAESPFRDEAMEEMDGILKKAAINFGQLGRSAAGAVGRGAAGVGAQAAGLALGGIALALAGDVYDAARRNITKARNYKTMMAANPDLADKPAPQVQSIFSTLHRFNPDFSADPVVAGSFVRNHVDLAGEGAGAVGLDAVKSLVDSRKNLNESRRIGKFDMPKSERPHPGGRPGGEPQALGGPHVGGRHPV